MPELKPLKCDMCHKKYKCKTAYEKHVVICSTNHKRIDKINDSTISEKQQLDENNSCNDNTFKLNDYLKNTEIYIQEALNKQKKCTYTYDMFETNEIKKYQFICLRVKQYQMKMGDILQYIIGTYDSFTNLHTGHSTGLDIISNTKKIAIELKYRTNTDNASAKLSNLNKLAKYKKENPDYICIYGCINDATEQKTIQGTIKNITHDNVEIQIYTGYALLTLIFGENTNAIITHVKNVLQKNMIIAD